MTGLTVRVVIFLSNCSGGASDGYLKSHLRFLLAHSWCSEWWPNCHIKQLCNQIHILTLLTYTGGYDYRKSLSEDLFLQLSVVHFLKCCSFWNQQQRLYVHDNSVMCQLNIKINEQCKLKIRLLQQGWLLNYTRQCISFWKQFNSVIIRWIWVSWDLFY